MITFEKSIHINRPQQEIFDFISNLENDTQWRDPESVERTSDGPIGVGSTWRHKLKFMGSEMILDIKIISYNPPHQFVTKFSGGPFPMELTHKLESQDSGTLLTLSTQAEVTGFFKIIKGMVKKQANKQTETELAALKKLLEAK